MNTQDKVTILFIDDQRFNHKVLAYILKNIDCTLISALSASEGIEQALTHLPHLILLDIEMPEMNGFETCTKLKTLPQTKDIPIIFLSSHDEEDYIVKGFELGGIDYIPKPFKPREVVVRIQSHLEKFLLQNALEQSKNELSQKNSVLEKALEEIEKKRLLENELQHYKEKYHTTQQESAFQKQIKIIHDHLSRRVFGNLLFDVFYKPLDILSGDAYSCIKIDDNRFLVYIVDAMGKGLSASVTSIQSMGFINNACEIAIERGDFNFESVLSEYVDYIRKQILEDEIVCASFLYIDKHEQTLSYSCYGMPPILIETFDGTIELLENNNPPIMEFLPAGAIQTIPIHHIRKLLVYSDGVNESHLADETGSYTKFIEEDFQSSLTLNEFIRAMQRRVGNVYDDDTTAIMIIQENAAPRHSHNLVIEPGYDKIEQALAELEDLFTFWDVGFKEQAELGLIANELLLNALEHGVLGISSDHKQLLAERGEMEEYVVRRIQDGSVIKQNIIIDVLQYETSEGQFVKLSIQDPGEGFVLETRMKEAHFDDTHSYHGRGIKIIDSLSEALHYNEAGNCVHVIKKY